MMPKVDKARTVVNTTTVNIIVKYFCILEMIETASSIFLDEKRMSGKMIIYVANKTYARLVIYSTLCTTISSKNDRLYQFSRLTLIDLRR